MRYDGLCEHDGVWDEYETEEVYSPSTAIECLSWCMEKRRDSPCVRYGPCGWMKDFESCYAYTLTPEKDVSVVSGYSGSFCWVWPGKLVSNAYRL